MEHPPATALIIGSDGGVRGSLADALSDPSLRTIEVSSAEDAAEILGSARVDAVFAYDSLGDMSGVDVLELVRRRWPAVRRVLVSGSDDAGMICEAINRAGVESILSMPWEDREIDRARREVVSPCGSGPHEKVVRVRADDASPGQVHGIIGRSPAVVALVDMIERVAQADSAVLITGETGTGKELVGHAIHRCSHRADQTFCAINSAAVPETLLESELFGHCRGAFTGANSNRKGLLEHASRGTVFLDELGEMPLSMQAKLLRFLQTGEIRPIGSETTRSVDVRLVSATNKDLEAEVAAGRFREDLYYRLAVIPINVPPLRERLEDIPLLAGHFLRQASDRMGKPVHGFTSDALAALMQHRWPGNIRELQNAIERGAALCRGEEIEVADLPPLDNRALGHDSYEDIHSLPGLERRHILETLDRVGWNRKKAASLLQISTTTLWRRLKEFGIDGAGTQSGSRVDINHVV